MTKSTNKQVAEMLQSQTDAQVEVARSTHTHVDSCLSQASHLSLILENKIQSLSVELEIIVLESSSH